jgi:hypothetical protein
MDSHNQVLSDPFLFALPTCPRFASIALHFDTNDATT